MKKGFLKRVTATVFAVALLVTSLPYTFVSYAYNPEDGTVLSGTITDEDNLLPGQTYKLGEDTVFSGDGVTWKFDKTTSIDLYGHELTLDGVTLSMEKGGLSITDSIGGGSISSDAAEMFHIEYKRGMFLSLENISLNYTGEDESVIPIYGESPIYLGDVTLHTETDYAIYADEALFMSGTSIWGPLTADVIFGPSGYLSYEKGYCTFPKKVRISLENLDFTEATTIPVIDTMGGGEVEEKIMKKLVFVDVPEDCVLMYRGGFYCAVHADMLELSGAYDLASLDFPNVSLDGEGKYQMESSYYKLTGDVSLTTPALDGQDSTQVFLGENKEVFIDLNGYTMDVNGMELRMNASGFTMMDSQGGGALNGGLSFYCTGADLNFESGVFNIAKEQRTCMCRGIPFLLFGESSVTVSDAVINSYYDSHEIFEGMTVNFSMTGGEINFYPTDAMDYRRDLFQMGSPAKGAINISGGTIRVEGRGVINMFNLLNGKMQVSGGTFIVKNTDLDSVPSRSQTSCIINNGFNMPVAISGGVFETNTDQCFIENSYSNVKPNYTFSGRPEFTSAKYDLRFKPQKFSKQMGEMSIELKGNFNIGRKMKLYTDHVPTEEDVVTFVSNWTTNRGEEDPAEVMEIYLPDGQTCTPVVVDGNVVSGGVIAAPEPEPEYVDGLEVIELSGTYALNALELPNTEIIPDKTDQYYWGDGYYRLTGDVTVTNVLASTSMKMAIVQANHDIVIDLNGHKLNMAPIRFSTTGVDSVTVVDSSTGGQMNGMVCFWGNGDYEFDGGTINMTGNAGDMNQAWAFNLSGGDLTVDGAVINCYHDSDTIMIQYIGNGTIAMKSGELNYIPTTTIPTFHDYLILAWGGKVEVSGGTMRAEASSKTVLISTLDNCDVSITGGKMISKCNGTNANYIADTRVIELDSMGTKVKTQISGGEMETNGDACVAAPYDSTVKLVFDGNVSMSSRAYDVFYSGNVVPMTIKGNFNLGRNMKVYTKKVIPSETNPVVFAADWAKLQGAKDPKDVFTVYLPDQTTRDPYVSEGVALCGGLPEDADTLHDTGNHTWSGAFDLTSSLPSGVSETDQANKKEVARGTYTLTADVDLNNSSESTIELYINKDVEIDLCGHELSGDNISLHIDQATGVLTIKDSVGGGRVTGNLELNSTTSSTVRLLGGTYDLKDPAGTRGRYYIAGSEFTANNAKFITYDNKNYRAGLYIKATKTSVENSEVQFSANDRSYALIVCAVYVKGNASFVNCKISGVNNGGEVAAVQREGGKAEFKNCILTSESKVITSSYGTRACALYDGGQYASGFAVVDGGEYIYNGLSGMYCSCSLTLGKAPKVTCSGEADILFSNPFSNTNYVTLEEKLSPSNKLRVGFRNQDFSKLGTNTRLFVKNWTDYMTGVSPYQVFTIVNNELEFSVEGNGLYYRLKGTSPAPAQEAEPVVEPTPAVEPTPVAEPTPAPVVVTPQTPVEEVVPATEQTVPATEEKTNTQDAQKPKSETKKNATAASGGNKNITSEKVNTSSKGTATVVAVSSKSKTVTLGSKVKVNGVNYTVTTVGKNAFKDCKKASTISLPKTVTTIQAGAFTGAKKLRTIKLNIKKSITVKKNAFKGINTSNVYIYVNKKMSKTELKKFQKELKAAGFKGTVKRKL